MYQLMKKARMFLLAVLAFWLSALSAGAQNVTVTGVVTDAGTGEPLAGATVRVSGSLTKYAMTDSFGNYSLSSVPSSATLEVMLLGYESATVRVEGKTVVNVELRPDTEYLDETIVVAYGVQKKSSFTGSAVQLSGEKLEKMQSTTYDRSLFRYAGIGRQHPDPRFRFRQRIHESAYRGGRRPVRGQPQFHTDDGH